MNQALCLEALKQHGVQAYAEGSQKVRALLVYSENGKRGEQWVSLPARLRTVLIWLGY